MINKGEKINMLKKVGFLFLILSSLIFILAACSNSNSDASNESSNSEYPNKAVELVVPFDAGGGTDSVARSLVDNTEKHFDESISVSNVSGGGGATGMTQVANDDPDGYHLMLATVELTTLPPMNLSDVTYEDFQPIAQINTDPGAITVQSDSDWDDAEEFIDYAKEHPGEVKVGNAGTGSIWHLVAGDIEKETGAEFKHVPYDGANPAVEALMSGEVDAVTVSPAEVLSQVESGDLETLAVSAEERTDTLPDVSTMEEAGVGNVVSGTWRGVVGPADMDEETVQILEDAFTKGAEEDNFKEFMEENGLGLEVTKSEDFEEHLEEESKDWESIIDDLDIEE